MEMWVGMGLMGLMALDTFPPSAYSESVTMGAYRFRRKQLRLEGMPGGTPPVIGVQQHNCQHAVCSRCLIRWRVSFVRPAGRREMSI